MSGLYEMPVFSRTAVLVIVLFDLLLFSFVYVRTAGVKVIGQDTTVIYGEDAFLLSELTDTQDRLTHIIWKKKTQEKPQETTFFAIRPGDKTEHTNGLGDRVQFIGNFAEKNGSIKLLRMRFLDEGIYTCIFNLFPSGTFETDINVTVFAHPEVKVEGQAPVAGCSETTLASCLASNARPPARVMWRLEDLVFLRTVTNQTAHPNGTVTVVSYLYGAPYKQLNKKNVQCVVQQSALKEELVLNYKINIHYPPESVVVIPDSATDAKEFYCIVDSNPQPTPSDYSWTRVNRSVPYYEGSKLPVPKPLSRDFNGLYICNASNKYGSSLGSLYVNVYTESNSVCWGLFSFFIICAVVGCGVVVAIYKFKPNLLPVPQTPDDGAAEGSEGL